MIIQEEELVYAIIQERLREAAQGERRRQAEALKGESASPRSVLARLTARLPVLLCGNMVPARRS
ncbi:MAG: hypothetical protein IH958_05945 [Chloroflexi bacterium]|nr:hypothetical protein [Chloroflexota bacterium]